MENFKIGYVPNLSQRIQEFTEKQMALFTSGKLQMGILPYNLGKEGNSLTFIAQLKDYSWFRLEFGLMDEVTFSNGIHCRYMGVYVPNLYSYYSGNYSMVYDYQSYSPVIRESSFYLNAMANISRYRDELIFIPIYSIIDTSRQLVLEEEYDPIEI